MARIPSSPVPLTDQGGYSRQRGRALYPRNVTANLLHIYGYRGRLLGSMDFDAPRRLPLTGTFQDIARFYADSSVTTRKIWIVVGVVGVQPAYSDSAIDSVHVAVSNAGTST